MKQIYLKAIRLLNMRLESCNRAIQSSTDEFSVLYWNKERAIVMLKIYKLRKRLKVDHNVIKIDFQTKKRVA